MSWFQKFRYNRKKKKLAKELNKCFDALAQLAETQGPGSEAFIQAAASLRRLCESRGLNMDEQLEERE